MEFLCFAVILSYVIIVIWKGWIEPAREVGKAGDAGYRITWTQGYIPDDRRKEPLERYWRSRGYRWHPGWRRWVPDIRLPVNQTYWESRGYTWSEARHRWYKLGTA